MGRTIHVEHDGGRWWTFPWYAHTGEFGNDGYVAQCGWTKRGTLWSLRRKVRQVERRKPKRIERVEVSW